MWLYQPSDLSTPVEPPLLDVHGIAEAIAFSPDGTLLAVTTPVSLSIWDSASKTMIGSSELKRASEAIAFSPDGAHLALNLGYDGVAL